MASPKRRESLRRLVFASCAMLSLAGCSTTATADCEDTQDIPTPRLLCAPLSDTSALNALIPAASLGKPGDSVPKSRVVPPLQHGKLRLKDALMRVIADSPELGIAAAKEREQFAAIRGAKAGRYPVIELSSSAGPQQSWNQGQVGTGTRREVGLSMRQMLYDFGATDNNQARAEFAHDSARSARLAKTEQVGFDLIETLMKVQQIDETIALTKRSIAAHQHILSIVERNESDGNSSVADIKRITTRLESARGNLIDLTTERASASDAFRRLTTFDVDMIIDTVTPRLRGQVLDVAGADIDRNHEIRAIGMEIASLDKQLAAAQSGALPSLGLEGSYKFGRQMSEPLESDRRHNGNILVVFRMPLMDGGANLSQREQILARLEGAQFRLEKRRRELREDGLGAARIVSTNQSKLASLEARVQSSRKVVDLYMLQFKEGGRTIFDLLDSQGDLLKAETDLINQKYMRRRAGLKSLLVRGELVSTIFGMDKS